MLSEELSAVALPPEDEGNDTPQLADVKQKTISGAASYMGRTLILFLLSMGASVFLAAYLSAEEFGVYGVVTQVIGLLTFFSDIGLASALIQKKTRPTVAEERTVFTVQQSLSWLIFAITFIVAATHILDAKIGPSGVWLLMALGFSFPLASLKTIPSVRLERRLDFAKLVIPQMVEQLAYNVILIFCAVRGFGVQSYTLAVLVRSLLGVVSMYFLQRWPIGFAWEKATVRQLVGAGAKFQLNDLLARVKDQLFYVVLGLWLPLKEFGYITFAKQFSFLPYQLTVQNVIAITFPTYARLQQHPHLLKRAIEKTLFFITLLIFPMLVGMCVFLEPLLRVFPRYSKWEPALLTFILFTLSIGWGAISTPLTNTLNAIGKISVTLKLMVMWTVLTWILTPIAIWAFGFQGVAIAAFVIAFTSILPVFEVRKIVPIRVWEEVWRQGFAAMCMAGVGLLGMSVWSRSIWWLVVGMSVAGAAYTITMLVVGQQKLLQEVRSLRQK